MHVHEYACLYMCKSTHICTIIYTYICTVYTGSFAFTHTAICTVCTYICTVEPLLKDSPNKGHHRNYLPTKDTLYGTKNRFSYSVNTFITSEEWTTSLQWTNYLVPMCPLYRGSTVQCTQAPLHLPTLPYVQYVRTYICTVYTGPFTSIHTATRTFNKLANVFSNIFRLE